MESNRMLLSGFLSGSAIAITQFARCEGLLE